MQGSKRVCFRLSVVGAGVGGPDSLRGLTTRNFTCQKYGPVRRNIACIEIDNTAPRDKEEDTSTVKHVHVKYG